MDLVYRGACDARRVAMLPAAWNPPTLAHLGLAEAALHFADEVLLVLPRVFPHKGFEHAGFDLRLEWLRRIAAARSGLGVGVSEGGLFLDMARALRAADARIEQVYVVSGRDAADRFLNWPYERGPGAIEQLREFSLLVAPRGEPNAPQRSRDREEAVVPGIDRSLRSRFCAGKTISIGMNAPRVPEGTIHTLSLDPKLSGISSSEVRRRIALGEPWTHLVPDEIAGEAGGIYR
jgi:nicotinic acid mononucleotide adenylyltransferase